MALEPIIQYLPPGLCLSTAADVNVFATLQLLCGYLVAVRILGVGIVTPITRDQDSGVWLRERKHVLL